MDIALWILGAVFVLAGLLGSVVPFLPGAPFVFVGAVLIAWAGDFAHVELWTLVTLFALMILSQTVDYIAGPAVAKRAGASNSSAIGALLGGIIGIFFGLVGVLVGPLIGAIVGELYHYPDLKKATSAGSAALWGTIIGVAVGVAISVSMVGIFIIALIW